MTQAISDTLAIDGGTPCVVDPPKSGFHGPAEIGEEEITAVTDVLRSKKLFRFGNDPEVSPTARFERKFAEMTEVPHALAVNSGTSALICAMVGLGVSSGDEVIVPAYTYIATASAVLKCGAIPVIAEVDESLTLDPEDVERKITPRTRCIVPVHMRGIPSHMAELLAVADKHGITILEDVAQANGGYYKGKPLGSLGHAAGFSLQQFKIITAGEGGAFVSKDKTIFDRGACYHDSAYTFWKQKNNDLSIEPFLGENYRMNEMGGALALVQLGRRDGILKRCRAIKRQWLDTVAELPGFKPQSVPDPEGDCGISLTLLADDQDQAQKIARALRAEGMKAGSTFDEGIPDRHIYYHWDYVINKRTPDASGYPWKGTDPACCVEYQKDMCPRSIELLGRSILIGINQQMSDAYVDSCCPALRKVHHHICG